MAEALGITPAQHMSVRLFMRDLARHLWRRAGGLSPGVTGSCTVHGGAQCAVSESGSHCYGAGPPIEGRVGLDMLRCGIVYNCVRGKSKAEANVAEQTVSVKEQTLGFV